MSKLRKAILATSVVLLVSACTDESGARLQLEGMGYSSIRITGYDFFGCGKDDGWHTGFEATDQTGKRVRGVVCSGLLKGSTVRIYGVVR